jgi:hypothetical protein
MPLIRIDAVEGRSTERVQTDVTRKTRLAMCATSRRTTAVSLHA